MTRICVLVMMSTCRPAAASHPGATTTGAGKDDARRMSVETPRTSQVRLLTGAVKRDVENFCQMRGMAAQTYREPGGEELFRHCLTELFYVPGDDLRNRIHSPCRGPLRHEPRARQRRQTRRRGFLRLQGCARPEVSVVWPFCKLCLIRTGSPRLLTRQGQGPGSRGPLITANAAHFFQRRNKSSLSGQDLWACGHQIIAVHEAV